MKAFRHSNLDFTKVEDLELFLSTCFTMESEQALCLFFEVPAFGEVLRERLDVLRSLAIFRLAAIEARKFDRYTIAEIIEELIVDELGE